MLKNIRVENFKNFENNIELDLGNVKKYEFNDHLVKNGIINDLVIFGKNGAGKSNLCFAIMNLVNNLTDNNKTDDNIKPLVNLNSGKEYASFYYEFIFEHHQLEYSYRKNNTLDLLEEELKIDHKTYVYYDYKHDNGFSKLKGSEALKKPVQIEDCRSYVKIVSGYALLEDDEINDVFNKFIDYVKKMLMFYSLQGNGYFGYKFGTEKIMDKIVRSKKVKDFEEFLNDIGIKCKLVSEEKNDEYIINVVYKHGAPADFFRVASTGTKSLALFYYWLIQAKDASMIIMDEFDAYYHFELSELIVKKVIKEVHGQVIFTSHNTGLMDNDLFRPDCLFVLSQNGVKPLCDLTEKELRISHNLQKMYKAGAFDE